MGVDIVPLTEAEKSKWPKEPLVTLPKPFVDARGEIIPLVDIDMRSCVMISSRRGTTRADHYHRTDWHFCYVVSGCIEYYHRPTGSREKPAKVVARAGQMIFTPPMVDHTMSFPEDTLFVTLGRNYRSQEVYEADVVRIESLLKEMEIPVG
ncbi:MAG: cupin domain-containing protein [Magnetococcales bacterium]|nr:cupin domain-containing protein [Magnetococcales bacterium]MBF0157628.1 cupin domain-containing protein [Magnetococcales bacterium]